MCDLTIILAVDHEKDPGYLSAFLGAQKHLNDAANQSVQYIALIQSDKAAEVETIVRNSGLDVELVPSCIARMSDGYPIWDIHGASAEIWPRVKGTYVTWQHTEFLWGKDRLARTIDWLREFQPPIALGNLLRPGANRKTGKWVPTDHCPCHSQPMRDAAESGAWDRLGNIIEATVPGWWIYWTTTCNHGEVRWLEDIFFAKREFIEVMGFLRHGGCLPFQDVYDTMGAAMQEFKANKIMVPCVRMPREVHRAVHLYHPKAWGYCRPDVRDWFLANADLWPGLHLVSQKWWHEVLKLNNHQREYQIVQVRRGPGGTVTKFQMDLRKWLRDGGGADIMRSYLSPAPTTQPVEAA